MVEIFKTNVQNTFQANIVISLLRRHFPQSRINFDLEDCDKILRIEGKDFLPDKVSRLVSQKGFICRVLE